MKEPITVSEFKQVSEQHMICINQIDLNQIELIKKTVHIPMA